MIKKVSIGKKPTNKKTSEAADAWVENHTAADGNATVKMKRLTIDIPEQLHREIKAQCAMRGTKIADEVRALLREKYLKS
jgi:hypothetical protein